MELLQTVPTLIAWVSPVTPIQHRDRNFKNSSQLIAGFPATIDCNAILAPFLLRMHYEMVGAVAYHPQLPIRMLPGQ